MRGMRHVLAEARDKLRHLHRFGRGGGNSVNLRQRKESNTALMEWVRTVANYSAVHEVRSCFLDWRYFSFCCGSAVL